MLTCFGNETVTLVHNIIFLRLYAHRITLFIEWATNRFRNWSTKKTYHLDGNTYLFNKFFTTKAKSNLCWNAWEDSYMQHFDKIAYLFQNQIHCIIAFCSELFNCGVYIFKKKTVESSKFYKFWGIGQMNILCMWFDVFQWLTCVSRSILLVVNSYVCRNTINRLRPYYVEYTGSRPITEVKQR